MDTQNNKDIQIQSYKHDGNLHRIWEKATIMFENDEFIIVANKRTKVIESNGRFWHTREPSVTWFYKKRWFNIIGIIKRDELHFYCNIASPYVIDDEALKYIDYDLDIKVLDDYSYTVLDRNEYNKHMERMQYPSELKQILEKELIVLRQMIETRQDPFNEKVVLDWYDKYTKLNKTNKL
jgi:protein associated with RNAse G/E